MPPLPIAPLLHEVMPSGPVAMFSLLWLGAIGVGLTALALRVHRAHGPVSLYLLAMLAALVVTGLFAVWMGEMDAVEDSFLFVLGGLLGVAAVAHWRARHGRERGSPGAWAMSAAGFVAGLIAGVVLTEALAGRL